MARVSVAGEMDPREMDALVQRLVQNPHDQEAITYAHHAGQSDPRSYAMLLEKVGTATSDPAFASHWLTEAANVWSTTLGDAHRAARALMIAIDRDPTQATPAERLAELYREKGDSRALVALLERRAKALAPLAEQDPQMRAHVAGIHEELGRLWAEPPLSQPKKAIDNYRRAVEFEPSSQYAIYAARELYKAAGQWLDAIPYFALEQALVSDPERRVALYQDEAEVRRSAGDLSGATEALRIARSIEGGADPGLKQLVASFVLERAQAGEPLGAPERAEAAQLFVELAEEYQGEHGYSYSTCALDLEPGNDRAVQLAMYYGAQLGRDAELAPRAAAYLAANPDGPLAGEARALAGQASPPAAARAASLAEEDSAPDASAPFAAAPNPDRVRALLDSADELIRKGKKGEAAAKYQEVVSLEPANHEAVGFLEGHLRQTRKYAELRDMLLGATRVPGVDGEARKGWLREIAGLCETQLRDLETAISAWKQLAALDRSDDGPRTQLRRLLERAGQWDDLATLLEQEAEQTTDVEARIALEKNLAKLHEQKRKDPVATGEAWARIAGLTPDDEAALTTAIRHFEKGQRPDLAAQAIADNVGTISDERARAHLYKKLGELREASGETLAAGEAYAEGAGVSKDPSLWEAAERCFVQAESWDQAATAIDERAKLGSRPKEQAGLYATEATYLTRAGDESSAVLRLEQATDLDPSSDEFAGTLEERYASAGRSDDLAAYLLRRAEKLQDKTARVALRKRAAVIQRDALSDPEMARESLLLVLNDGDDVEALTLLADDADARGEASEAVDYLHRLGKAVSGAEKLEIVMREAALVAERLDDAEGAIERYELVLRELDPKSEAALTAIVELHDKRGDARATAEALERHLGIAEDTAVKLDLAQRLAGLYEGPLDDQRAAIRALDIVRELDAEDFDALQRLAELAEAVEDWPRVASHLAALIEVEGDDAEVSRMTRRLAEILHEKVGKGDEALAALLGVADGGDEESRQAYVKLGDELGWKGIVATKLVEWYLEAPIGPARNESLRGAFERFVEVGRDADAANVAKELARTRGADAELAQRLEELAIKLKDVDALGVAHDLMIDGLSGPPRAEELVRQAEVLLEAGVDPEEAIQHGEQALTSVAPEEVEPLLARIAKIAQTPGHVIDLYERQVTRCKAPNDRLRALARAAEIAAEHGALDRARGFFDLALGGGVQDETLSALEEVAREGDTASGGTRLRATLAEALAAGGQGSRDGGRTRSALLRRAARIAFSDLGDADRAFRWLGDALVTHVDDEGLDALEAFALEVGDPRRIEAVLDRALEEVFDGPLVRKLLARRASTRRDRLDDKLGAAGDLKRLHDLSPSDTDVMDQLSRLYTELEDWRGMVQLYEDQILRGKDQAARAELARKVARLWEEKLFDAREAADAWRRVLRMKAGDPEATEGLERAKADMLKPRSERPAPPAARSAPPPARSSTPPPAPKPEPDPEPAPAELAPAEPEPGALPAEPGSARAAEGATTTTERTAPPAPPEHHADDERTVTEVALTPDAGAAQDDDEDEDVPTVPPPPEAAEATHESPASASEAALPSSPPPRSVPPPPPSRASGRPPPRSAPPPPSSHEAVPVEDDAEDVDEDELVVDDAELLDD